MASRTIQFKTTNQYIYQGTLDLINNPINIALLASTYDPVAAWSASTAKVDGDVIQPTVSNGHYYRYTDTGGGNDTGAVEPTWPTDGTTVDDNGMEVTDIGTTLPISGGKDSVFADVVAHEITGTGYTAGGVILANKALITQADVSWIAADDPEWLNSTLAARWSVRYLAATVNAVVNPLISCTLLDDTPADVVTDNSRLRLILPATGVHSLTVA